MLCCIDFPSVVNGSKIASVRCAYVVLYWYREGETFWTTHLVERIIFSLTSYTIIPYFQKYTETNFNIRTRKSWQRICICYDLLTFFIIIYERIHIITAYNPYIYSWNNILHWWNNSCIWMGIKNRTIMTYWIILFSRLPLLLSLCTHFLF